MTVIGHIHYEKRIMLKATLLDNDWKDWVGRTEGDNADWLESALGYEVGLANCIWWTPNSDD